VSPLTRMHFAAAPQAVEATAEHAVLTDDLTDVDEVPDDLLEVDAASVADESLKIKNCNLSPQTVQACLANCLLCRHTRSAFMW